ncbi:hypothetical protein BO221_49745 [Archangium sp. Cb G35]|nr:hypothetical protein BO221_49745 [Archangium sp. Cb G35]
MATCARGHAVSLAAIGFHTRIVQRPAVVQNTGHGWRGTPPHESPEATMNAPIDLAVVDALFAQEARAA